MVDGLDKVEPQTITSELESGTFKLSYNEKETAEISWDAEAEDVEKALLALDTTGPLRVSQKSTGGPYIWEVTFLGPTNAPMPGTHTIVSKNDKVKIKRRVLEKI